jgi:hypothetical protein
MKIFFAGILGGIAMFAWGFVAHMVLPLGEAGMKELPNESAVRGALSSNIGEADGLYHFPGLGVGKDATRQERNEAMKRAMEKVTSGPSGLLVYHPTRPFSFGKALGIQFVTEIVEALLAVFLLAQTRIAGFGGRVGFVFVAGVLAAIATNIPYWNWYGFPAVYTISYMSIQIIAFLWAGVVAALILRRTDLGAAS